MKHPLQKKGMITIGNTGNIVVNYKKKGYIEIPFTETVSVFFK